MGALGAGRAPRMWTQMWTMMWTTGMHYKLILNFFNLKKFSCLFSVLHCLQWMLSITSIFEGHFSLVSTKLFGKLESIQRPQWKPFKMKEDCQFRTIGPLELSREVDSRWKKSNMVRLFSSLSTLSKIAYKRRKMNRKSPSFSRPLSSGGSESCASVQTTYASRFVGNFSGRWPPDWMAITAMLIKTMAIIWKVPADCLMPGHWRFKLLSEKENRISSRFR